jgi:SAM-dependent MidA family methyltransferase
MHAGNLVLIDFIRDTIRRRGPVTFAWFMDQALYHPQHGFYSAGRCSIGRRGDYFTNVSVGPLFGQLLAAQFDEMWEVLGRPDDFVIVEQGAHEGDFARDVLTAARDTKPGFFSALRYRIIESFPLLEQRQASTLADFKEKVVWRKSLDQVEPFCGVHFSNELLDAMPVHWIRKTAHLEGWEELYVAESGAEFVIIAQPIQDPKLQQHLARIPQPAAKPYETEVNLAAVEWMKTLAPKLTRGFILVVDYGHARDRFYAPERQNGTLRCYAQQRFVPSPLEGIGHVDITAHVDWTSIAECAEQNGLRVSGFTDQHRFMTGLVTTLAQATFAPESDLTTRGALQTLFHPDFLGTTFQFLGLTKNVDPEIVLSGFRFGRDARAALGL